MTADQPLQMGAVAALLVLSACAEAPSGQDRGPALYETCAPCHGDDAEGSREFEAPSLAGLPEWYLVAQLEKFRTGARGDHPDDTNGLRMRGMIRTLNHDGDVEAVAAHLAGLPPAPNAPVMNGDAGRGRELFAPCAECHQEDGSGDPAQDAPPLTLLDDWYVVAQLQAFKAGIRGTDPEDASGATMRPMALGLADEQAMADLAAYIRTLRSE